MTPERRSISFLTHADAGTVYCWQDLDSYGTLALIERATVDLGAAASTAHDIVTSAAVVVGGTWVYFNYIRGRTFAQRAQLDVVSSLKGGGSTRYLCATVTLKNTGQAKLPLNGNMKALRLYVIVDQASDDISVAKWKRIVTLPIFEQHAWLEAQETVTDTVVYKLCDGDGGSDHYSAYQVEAVVGTRRRIITRKGTLWQSRSLLFVEAASAGDGELGSQDSIRMSKSRKIKQGGEHSDGKKETEEVRQG
jgi:hypothetical protein